VKTSISMTTEFLIAGAIFILVSIPLWLGKIPPNRLYGIRIPKAFESTELWYKVNALGGGIMILYGVIMLFAGTALFILSKRMTVDFNLSTIGLYVLIWASLVHILLACNQIQ
jgi:uncharacterized membrane protein